MLVRSTEFPVTGHHADWSRLGRVAAVALALAVVIGAAGGTTAVAAKGPDRYYAPVTGHALGEPFLSRWAATDGMNTLGYPVSEPATFDGTPAQYFEYGVLQVTSTIGKKPRVDAVAAGRQLLAVRHEPDRTVAGRRVGGDRNATAFAPLRAAAPAANDRFQLETGHRVTGRIEAYFDQNGGGNRFGKPLSDSYVSCGVRLQWFERGRVQWSLGDGKVTAGPVGFELARATGVATGKIDGRALPVLDPKRFRVYQGDGTIPEAPGTFVPAHIIIPRIGINAAIEQVGIVNRVMGTPQNAWNVGWYPTIAKPGESTNVVMAGHKDWWGIGPAVFWSLDQLTPGDKIYLLAKNGKGFTYVVTKAWQIDAGADASGVIGDTGGEALTLITCGGAFDGAEYLSRHIVRAERI